MAMSCYRFISGVADVTVWNSSVAILTRISPDKSAFIVGCSEAVLGAGVCFGEMRIIQYLHSFLERKNGIFLGEMQCTDI